MMRRPRVRSLRSRVALWMFVATLLSLTMFVLVSVFIDRQGPRIFLSQPGGRSGSGCSQNGDNAIRCQQVNGAVQPVEVEFSFGGLEGAPGKFAHAHNREPGFFHQADILGPARFVPVLGVV